jgi:hypothetical protein
VILTNHQRFIDINLERYFECKEFDLDKIDSSKLDSRKAMHKALFVEKVEEYID